jgi:hypothetical protein
MLTFLLLLAPLLLLCTLRLRFLQPLILPLLQHSHFRLLLLVLGMLEAHLPIPLLLLLPWCHHRSNVLPPCFARPSPLPPLPRVLVLAP